jgi:hypothetical protein
VKGLKLRNIVFTALIGLLAMPAWTPAEPSNPRVLPVDSTPYGNSYGEWSAVWFQWALSLPATRHPLFDTADCGEGQSGPVFFLGGRFCAFPPPPGQTCDASVFARTCTVPAGKALFFPILNVEDSLIEEAAASSGINTVAGLRVVAASITDGITDLAAEVDGHGVRDLDAFRVQSPSFRITLTPEHNVLAAIGETGIPDGATSLAVADGVYLMLAPLPVGKHTVHFHGGCGAVCGNFTIDGTYHLNVVGSPAGH